MPADDPERLILVLRMAVKMRKLQKEAETYGTNQNPSLVVKAEREFDIAVGALKL